jgi:ATP-binding cassette subfamily B protein
MPKRYANGWTCARRFTRRWPPSLEQRTFRERLGALSNLAAVPEARLEDESRADRQPGRAAHRARAAAGVTLYVGKLIIDEVVRLAGGRSSITAARVDRERRARPHRRLLALEFALAVASDVLGRYVSLLDSLLSERFSTETSLRLMEHAATLDLEDFEDSELQDRLERARRQAAGRTSLIGQLMGQAQDVRHQSASFRSGLLVYAPC